MKRPVFNSVVAAVSCKICNADSQFLIALRDLDIHLCRSCGLTFVAAKFSDAELASFYNQDEEHYYETIATLTDQKNREAVRDLAAINADSILDVGCGNGNLLEHLRHLKPKSNICGLELSELWATRAEQKGFTVYREPIEKLRVSFDLLTLMDVAEHVSRPLEFLRGCRDALSDRGIIYIHTPRRCGWDSFFIALARLPVLKRIAAVWLATRLTKAHLQLWSDRALHTALEAVGLRILSYDMRCEMSFPLEKYVEFNLPIPRSLRKTATFLIRHTIVPSLKNKAVVVATSRQGMERL